MILGSNRCCVNNVFKGITGEDGKIGVAGPIGIMGYTGSTGITGPQGATGLCYRGYKGPQGFIGPQGGSQGNAGPIGPVGLAGPTGSTGSTGSNRNLNFSFTTSTTSSYSSPGYTDLTNLASGSVSNIITLGSGTYAINFEINEDWTDTGNKFYVGFYNGLTYEYSTVFTQTTPLVLNTNTSISKMYCIGNDLINLTATNYTINLFQSTTSGTINIPSKTVNFSITFIQLS